MSLDKYHQSLAPGDVLFREGDKGNCAYIVEDGALEVSQMAGDKRRVLATLGPGEIVGELTLIEDGFRSATVSAATHSEITLVTREQLAHRLEECDPLVRMLLSSIIERFRGTLKGRRKGDRDGDDPHDRFITSDVVPHRAQAEYDELRQEIRHAIQVEQELEQALEDNQFVLYYQPIMHCKDETPAGFEALIRWIHPERGLVSPLDFIELAERTGLIVDIGAWALRQACADGVMLAEKCASLGFVLPFMGVNVSPRQFLDDELYDQVNLAIDESGIRPDLLKLEITESLLVEDPGAVVDKLQAFRDLGARIAIDDFGTGYSSLSYLQNFPVDALKIDRAFVSEMYNEGGDKIVRAIATLARSLTLEVIAEGMEEYAQLNGLRALGVDFIQGFYYSKPLPLEDVVAYLETLAAG